MVSHTLFSYLEVRVLQLVKKVPFTYFLINDS